jgi:hypothetical protein
LFRQGAETEPFDPVEEEPELDIDDLPETDLEIIRDAKREQARFEASDSYGDEPFETVEDDNGHVLVKPKLTKPSLSELLLLAKIKRAEHVATQSRMLPARSTGSSETVKRLFAKARSRTAPIPDGGARPPAKASGWPWLRARFAAPRKPVWR